MHAVFGEFVPADLRLENVAALSGSWVEASQKEGSAPAALWPLLTEKQRETLRGLADAQRGGPHERQLLLGVLNGLVQNRSLHEGSALQPLLATVSDDNIRRSIESIRNELKQTFDESQSRRLNRFLLASAFEDYVRTPRFNLVELVTWKRLDVSVQSLSVSEGFMIWVKAALISGFVLASPWIFYQIWEFVAAGLYPHEKHFIHIFLPFSLLLFLAGAALAFFFVFEPVLEFLFSFNRKMNIEAMPRISEWLSFVLFLPVGFGISFQLPLVMLFLERIGILSLSSYISKWRVSILAIFVIAMVLTPADPISMLLMAVPLTFLYFGGILLCRYMPRRTSPIGEGYDA